MNAVQIVIQGALLGGLYALFAIGLSLSFGIMRLVNIAHGDLIVLSAYVGRNGGDQVLKGKIHRGDGEEIEASILFTDIAGFTPALTAGGFLG